MTSLENLRIYDYWMLVTMTTSLTLHLNVIILFTLLFINVYYEYVSASQLVILAEVTTFFGYIVWMAYVRHRGARFRYEGKSGLLGKFSSML